MMIVPTYPEDGSRALKMYQHQQTMVVRVGHKAPVVRVEGTIISRLRRPIRLGGWGRHGKTARSALYLTVKVAGGGTSVHACSVFPRRKVRLGIR